MRHPVRVAAFAVGAVALLGALVWGVSGLPSFGHYPGPYGDEVISAAVNSRHADNAVSTVVMDIRAVDTAAEELILLAAAVGVLMLLRPLETEVAEPLPPGTEAARDRFPPSTPVRVACSVLVAPVALLGLYVVAHGQITPGGGFQGGVVLSVPSVLLLLAWQRRSFDRLNPPRPWEIGQAVAVTGFLAAGFAGLFSASGAFLDNGLPRGAIGTVFSAGTIPVLNVVAGVAVATAIVLLVVINVHQVVVVRRK